MHLEALSLVLFLSLNLVCALPTDEVAGSSIFFERAIGSTCSTPVRWSYSLYPF